ncbi:YetF domain-containing protein [Spirillospora sp. NPDC049652]
MWHDLMHVQIPVADKVIRTFAVYLLIVVLLRLAGKRELAQLNGFDFVVMLLLSNVVQNAIIGPDNSLLGGALGAVLLVAANAVFVRLVLLVPWLHRLVHGRPSVLVWNGQWRERTLFRLGLGKPDVVQGILEQGGDGVHDTRVVTLEPQGSLVVRLRESEQSSDKSDMADLRARLERIEAHLAALAAK